MPEKKTIKRIGHITPSSNIVLEPLIGRLNMALDGAASQHFTRLSVRGVALDTASEDQFALERLVAAAQLLAEAPLDAIVWNGTAGSWRGSAHDRRIVAAICRETGLAATTATLAIHEILRRRGWNRIALAVPYTADVTARIVSEYARDGVSVIHSASLGLIDNTEIGDVPPSTIAALVASAYHPDTDCIAVVCTNFSALPNLDELEQRIGRPIVDSVAVTFLEGCRLAGLAPRLTGWGSILDAGG